MMLEADGLDALVADLAGAPVKVQAGGIAIIQRGALNIKRDAQRFSAGIGHAPHYPRSITYETTVRVGDVEAVIGPDKDRPQGALGNLLEFGSSNNAPISHLGPALDLEGPRFVKALGDIAGDIL
ncbi:hypothetical protein [Iamia sp.]|uniref:hypothetical protein n=1 Tax=Iamia sp. TaxID=2722710 RepID=UPI002C6A6715|nr:hypothetical protein [Iamia sp.]HXH57727.1 hypothetical protein [Iamia sp.]